MATCPRCGASSRTDPTFTITEKITARPIGDWSLAGVQTKFNATTTLVLTHEACGWSVEGWLDGNNFVARPPDPQPPHRGDPSDATITASDAWKMLTEPPEGDDR